MIEMYEMYKQLCNWWFALPFVGFAIFVLFYIVVETYDQIKYKNRFKYKNRYVPPDHIRNVSICDYTDDRPLSTSPEYRTPITNYSRQDVIPFLNTLDTTHTDVTEQMSKILYPDYSPHTSFIYRYFLKSIDAIYIYKLNELGYYFAYLAPVPRNKSRYRRNIELIFELQLTEDSTNSVPYIPHFVCQRHTSERKAALYPSDYRFKKQPYRDHIFLIQNTKNHESTKILDQLFENDAIIVPLHNLTEMGAVVTVTNVAVHIWYNYQKDYNKIVEYTNLLKEALPRPQKSCPDYTKHLEFQNSLPDILKDVRAIDIPPIRNSLILAFIALLLFLFVEVDPTKNNHISIPELLLPSFILVFFTLNTNSFTYKIRRMWILVFCIVPFTALSLSTILRYLPW